MEFPCICYKIESGKWKLLYYLRQINAVLKPMGPLQEGLPSAAMILKDWDMVTIDLKDCFFTIPLAVAVREKFLLLSFLNLQAPSEGFQ